MAKDTILAGSPATFGSPGEYSIRYGEAAPVKQNKSIIIDGTLGAPQQFLVGRGLINNERTNLQIFNDTGRLVLTINDNDPHTTDIISGKLTDDTVLKGFQINTEKRWGIREFTKFAKMNRFYFADEAELNSLIASLQKFEATVQKTIKDHNDNTGNSLLHLETKVHDITIVNKFKLRVPIFQGYQTHVFTVEIGLDTKSTAVDLFLISDELYKLIPEVRAELMSMELAKFADYSFARVVVS
jgi:hypothetical protein